jgi:hypothetical protein
VIPVGFIFQRLYKPRFVDVGIILQRYVPKIRIAVGQALECFCSHDVSIYQDKKQVTKLDEKPQLSKRMR